MYSALQGQIAVGMKVRTLDNEAIGRVKAVHGDTFEIEKGFFFRHNHEAAFSEISRIDDGGVVLTVSEGALEAMRGPVGTSLRDRAGGAMEHALDAIEDAARAVSSRPPAPKH